MNLLNEILKEHSKTQTDKIVQWVGSDAEKFNELLALFLGDEYRISQRAGWSLGDIACKHPELIYPHLKIFVNNLSKQHIHNAVKRNTVRVLQFLTIPDEMVEDTLNQCFTLFANKKEDIAIRVFAMTVLANICQKLPEIKEELKIMIEDELPYASPGFVSRGRKMLGKLKTR